MSKKSKLLLMNEIVFNDTEGLKKKELAVKVAKNFENLFPGYRVIYLSETGSQVQGTSKADYNQIGGKTDSSSDFDAKGIFIPSLESLITGEEIKTYEFNSNIESKNTESDIDVSFIPINEFLKKISKGMETNAVELLFSMFREDTIILQDNKLIDLLRDNYKSLLFNETRSLTGFAISQANKYSVKGDRLKELQALNDWFSLEVEKLNLTKKRKKEVSINVIPFLSFIKESEFKYIQIVHIEHSGKINPYIRVLGKEFILSLKIDNFENTLNSKIKSFGERVKVAATKETASVDYKSYSHAIRAIHQAKELIETGFLKLPTPNATEIMRIKFGEIKDIETLTNRLDELDEELKILIDSGESELPDRSDEEFIKRFKLDCYNL